MALPERDILAELRMASRIITNAEQLMTPEQLEEWRRVNPIGNTRHAERLRITEALNACINDPMRKRKARMPFIF